MITQVTNGNKEFFITLAPDFMLDLISNEYIDAFGDYTRDDEGHVVATGIIIFSNVKDKPCILWHFVDEDYLFQGIGESLLDLIISNYENVSMLFSTKYVSDAYFEDVSQYYEDYGFKTSSSLKVSEPDFLFVAKSLDQYPLLKDITTQYVLPLEKLPNFEINTVVEKLTATSNTDISSFALNQIDKAISCATYQDGKITSILLASKTDGYISILSIINLSNGSAKNILKLLKYFIQEVSSQYPDGIRVHIVASQARKGQGQVLKKLLPNMSEYLPHVMEFKASNLNLSQLPQPE